MIHPAAIANGFATVDELVDDGSFADPHQPHIRRVMARGLARLAELTRPLGQPRALRHSWSLWDGDGLWPPSAHSPVFDFAATTPGAQWIDEIAAEAKSAIPGGEQVVVHSDWSSKHFRFGSDHEITVVYDWDSLTLETEVQALGTAAATFTANFELDVRHAPSPREVTSFIEEYSAVRQTPLRGDEVLGAHAVATYLIAARCEHSLGSSGHFSQALARFGRDYLAPSPKA